MKLTLKYSWLPTALFLGLIFSLSIIPLIDYDLWFHLKAGELFLQKGIIHYDVFSYNTAGREWYPYEWLFQVSLYVIQKFLGFSAIQYLVAGVITGLIGVYYRILRRIFSLSRYASFVVAAFFFASVYEFFSARPHVIAYFLLLSNLYLILVYIKSGKNRLWLTIPSTLIWANLHASIFLDVYFFGAFTTISLFLYWLEKDRLWITKAKVLALYVFVTFFLTILPPLYFTQYRLLWYFFKNQTLLSHFIDEWTPLATNPTGFWFFTGAALGVTVFTVLVAWKRKAWHRALLLLPIFPLVPLTYSASRNIVLGYIALGLMLGWAVSLVNWRRSSVWLKGILALSALSVLGFSWWLVAQKRVWPPLYYPMKAIQFLKNYHINGHMFNEYGYGGYLLYHLYPDYQVFFDGRTDLYIGLELPDTLELAIHKNEPDTQFRAVLDTLWKNYDISFVMIRTEKHSVLRKIGRILTDDPMWSLVYWDDDVQIFVRHDGKNNRLLEKFSTIAATPYDRNPYRAGQTTTALAEYSLMNAVSESARSLNAIGFIFLQQGKIAQAQATFERAVVVDPLFESPYMNLGEIVASQGNYLQAITFYQKAMDLAPDRGLIYIRLGQLYISANNDVLTAHKIWQLGLKNTLDEEAKTTLKRLLGQ